MPKKSLDKFVVVKTTGETVELDTIDVDVITAQVGSPFDNARILPGFEMYIRDYGLFDGSQLNIPLAITFELPIMGDVLVHGGADRYGNTVKPWFDTAQSGQHFDDLRAVCKRLWNVYEDVERNRSNPFTVYSFNPQTGEFEEMR